MEAGRELGDKLKASVGIELIVKPQQGKPAHRASMLPDDCIKRDPERENFALLPIASRPANSIHIRVTFNVVTRYKAAMGCKWSNLNVPGTENPLSHPLLGLKEFPFPIIGPLG